MTTRSLSLGAARFPGPDHRLLVAALMLSSVLVVLQLAQAGAGVT